MKNLSINKKLLLMLLIPVLALIFFAGGVLSERQTVASNMTTVQENVDLAAAANALVHQLQRERGMSAGYLGSGGQDFADELVSQRAATDAALAEFEELVNAGDIQAQSSEFADSSQIVAQRLAELANRRDAISAQRTSSDDAIAYYSDTNAALIGLVSNVAALLTDAELAHRFGSYVALMLQKEFAGIERALLSSAFAADNFTDPGHFQYFIEVVAKQEGYEELFRMSAFRGDLRSYQEAIDSGGAHRQMRNIAMAQGLDGNFGIAPDAWFQAATDHIDALGEAEAQLTASIIDGADELRSSAQSALYFFAIITLLTILLAAGITQWIGRSISNPLAQTSNLAQQIAQQLVATATQQSASVSETATAVSQTSTTVDELRQTSQVAADRSNAVREKSEKSVIASDEALTAISDGMHAMNRIREEVESIAQNILELSEKNIQIGEIVQSVGAIAEQSNLLAVNASIEAAQAGEHGKGFSVVASEVKALAAQSKEATAQIRSILSEIQKSSNAAVMVTEQGTKRVEESASLIENLGDTVRSLGSSIEDSLEASMQISATANQQLTGIEEITVAMSNIEQATQENAAGTQQLEEVAREVQTMSEQLNYVVVGVSKRLSA